MSERWYRGYTAYGIPRDVIIRVASEIKKLNYGIFMPRVCVEPNNKKSNFYFFIGINSDIIGKPPDEVLKFEGWLILNHIRLFQGGECVLQNDLTKSWLKREVGIEYTRKLSQIVNEKALYNNENPFELSEESNKYEGQDQIFNHLLYWMSTNGDGSFQIFRNACAQLHLGKPLKPRNLFRQIRLLGHGEYLSDVDHWTICPSCFVQIENEENKYKCFLSGSRSPKLIEKLPNISEKSQTTQNAPDTIFVTFDAVDEAQSVIAEIQKTTDWEIKLAGSSSTKLANILPDINDWQSTFLQKIPINNERYKICQWDGKDFTIWVDTPKDFGMYHLTDSHQNEMAPDYYFFFDPQKNSWYQGDWYGLRYLANLYLDNLPTLIHNTVEKQLFIPHTHRLPEIYEKVFVLASGELALRNNTGVIYKNISSDLATNIANKVSAKIDWR